MPSGCPKQSWNPDVNSYKWFDPTGGGGSLEKCRMRRQTINNDCGKTDAMMAYRGSDGLNFVNIGGGDSKILEEDLRFPS